MSAFFFFFFPLPASKGLELWASHPGKNAHRLPLSIRHTWSIDPRPAPSAPSLLSLWLAWHDEDSDNNMTQLVSVNVAPTKWQVMNILLHAGQGGIMLFIWLTLTIDSVINFISQSAGKVESIMNTFLWKVSGLHHSLVNPCFFQNEHQSNLS